MWEDDKKKTRWDDVKLAIEKQKKNLCCKISETGIRKRKGWRRGDEGREGGSVVEREP